MLSNHKAITITVILTLLAVGTAPADEYAIAWYTIDGGGGLFSTGGEFGLGGTIAQPDASRVAMTGGAFGLIGGFWSGPTAPALVRVLLVCSKETDRVLAYRGDTGAFLREIAGPRGGIHYPNGILFDGVDAFYVSSVETNSVLKYSLLSGEPLLQFSGGGLSGPVGLQFGSAGTLLVASYDTNSVKEYNLATGHWAGDFVHPGSGGLDGPTAILRAPNGNLVVCSEHTDQVLEYDGQTGAFVRVAAQGGGLSVPAGLLFDHAGNLLVASFHTNAVLKYAPDGTYLGEFVPSGSGGLSGAQGLAWGPNDNLLVSSRFTDAVLEYDRDDGAFVGAFAAGGGLDEPTYLSYALVYGQDCNANGVIDQWDTAMGTSSDFNGDGIPDECEGLGDLNCDGVVNFGDIDPFVLALSDPAGYHAAFPNCDILTGDCNGDGQVNFADIDPFVALLSG